MVQMVLKAPIEQLPASYKLAKTMGDTIEISK